MNSCKRTGLVQKGEGNCLGWPGQVPRGEHKRSSPSNPLPDFMQPALGAFLALLTLGQPGGDRRWRMPLLKFCVSTSPSDPRLSPVQGGWVDAVPSDTWET